VFSVSTLDIDLESFNISLLGLKFVSETSNLLYGRLSIFAQLLRMFSSLFGSGG
jgi:hypothetical protein